MVGSVLPTRQGGEPPGALTVRIGSHGIGSVGSSMALGGLLGALGSRLPTADHPAVVVVAVGLVALAYSLRETGLVTIPAPQSHRQVPNRWRWRYPPTVASFLYGAGLGIGVATRIPVTSFYAVLLWSFLRGSVTLGAGVMATYGLGRLLPLLLLAWAGHGSAAVLERIIDSVEPAKPLVSMLNGLAMAAAGAYLVVTGVAG